MNKECQILHHTISYYFHGQDDLEINECEETHIEDMIREGYSSGTLSQYNHETNEEFNGWWEINNKDLDLNFYIEELIIFSKELVKAIVDNVDYDTDKINSEGVVKIQYIADEIKTLKSLIKQIEEK